MSPEEIDELKNAVSDLSDYLTSLLRNQTQYGAYSMSALGEEAVTYFTRRAIVTFFKGTWERYKNEIIDIRKRYGISAAKMSQILGIGVNQYRLYEQGEEHSALLYRIR
jgi:DNA-binding transcriptional regulator YiaG